MKNKIAYALMGIFMVGCAGTQRKCSSSCATSLGADWIIVQYRNSGEPLNCWKLNNVSVANEEQSDGVYWQDSKGHLVHVSGWYNRVQVESKDWKGAADSLGIDLESCTNGKYNTKEPEKHP